MSGCRNRHCIRISNKIGENSQLALCGDSYLQYAGQVVANIDINHGRIGAKRNKHISGLPGAAIVFVFLFKTINHQVIYRPEWHFSILTTLYVERKLYL